jgi:hypothetical protein
MAGKKKGVAKKAAPESEFDEQVFEAENQEQGPEAKKTVESLLKKNDALDSKQKMNNDLKNHSKFDKFKKGAV